MGTQLFMSIRWKAFLRQCASSINFPYLLKIGIAGILSVPLAFWMAQVIMSNPPHQEPKGSESLRAVKSSDTDSSPVSVAAKSETGMFPLLNNELILVSQLTPILRSMQPVFNIPNEESDYRETFIAGRGWPRLLLVVDNTVLTEVYGHYERVCSELMVDCLMAGIMPEGPPVQISRSVKNIPTFRLAGNQVGELARLLPHASKATGAYIFDLQGRLIWRDNLQFLDRAPEIVLKTIGSVQASPDSASSSSASLLKADEADVNKSPGRRADTVGTGVGAEKPAGSTPVSVPADPGKSIEEKVVAKPAIPLKVSTLGLKDLSSLVMAVENPKKSVKFSEAWAVKHVTSSKRPLLLVFWATWCAPCREEIPLLGELSRKYDSTLFVGLIDDPNTEEIRRDVKSLVEGEGLKAQYLLRDKSIARRIFGQQDVGLPAFALFDAEGRLTKTAFIGAIKRTDLRELLESGLKEVQRQ